MYISNWQREKTRSKIQRIQYQLKRVGGCVQNIELKAWCNNEIGNPKTIVLKGIIQTICRTKTYTKETETLEIPIEILESFLLEQTK